MVIGAGAPANQKLQNMIDYGDDFDSKKIELVEVRGNKRCVT